MSNIERRSVRLPDSSRTVGTCGLAAVLLSIAFVGVSSPAEAGVATQRARAAQIDATNDTRAAHGCRALTTSKKLTRAAQGHANDMSKKNYFSHTSQDGRSWIYRIRAKGFKKPGGENIARGFRSANDVHIAWMNSPGHRRNIVNCQFKQIGLGYNAAGGYWVQDFGY